MRMKKIIAGLIAAISTATLAVSITAAAEAHFTKEEVIEGIWEERWRGKRDDGTIYPEASYKYNLIVDWVEENYEEYSYASEMHTWEYYYDNYYDNLTEHLEFNDDDNGNWTITTDTGEFYYFEFIQGQWNQFDGNGNVVDMFPPISTLFPGETMEDANPDYDEDYDDEYYEEDDNSEYLEDSELSDDIEDDDANNIDYADDDSTDRPAGEDDSADRPAGTQSNKQNNSSNKSQAVVSGTINPNEHAAVATSVSTEPQKENKEENNSSTLIIVLGSLVVVAGGLGTAYVIKKKKK